MSVRAGILVTGTEVLSGYVTDRNGPWISEQLADLGVEVAEITVVGDRPEDLEGALRHMRDEGLDLIFTSGGLGPTADDLTAEVVGRFAGRELVLDEEMEQKIADIIARYARRLRFDPEAVREANRKQAMVPEGAVAIDPAGTAPGLVVPADGQVVIVLPGPPRELQEMWPRALAAAPAQEVLEPRRALRDDVDPDVRDPRVRARHGAARDRGRRASRSASWRSPPACAAASWSPTSATATDSEEAAEGLRAGLAERLGQFTYTESGESIEEVVFRLLGDRTIAVAESESGGLLAGAPDAAARAPRSGSPAASSPTRTSPRPSCSASIRS